MNKILAFIAAASAFLAVLYRGKQKTQKIKGELQKDRRRQAQNSARSLNKINENIEAARIARAEEEQRVNDEIKNNPNRRDHLDNNSV